MNCFSRQIRTWTVKRIVWCLAFSGVLVSWTLHLSQAQQIPNEVAVFAALDKVTARISHLEIKIDETVKFGALKVTPRTCFTRPPEEPPLTSAFVEVQEIKLSGEEQKIFSGWMFAQSPGINAVQHPVFDVWLTNCKTVSGDASAGNRRKSERNSNASSNRR
ncbi:MAG: DUF2155 domain-containing protein [Methyloligellaceae bacterium]